MTASVGSLPSEKARHALRGRVDVPPNQACMLYGSQARGTATTESDIDVLVLSSKRFTGSVIAPVNVTSYASDHLRLMARRGSLFVRHLRQEGVLLQDPGGELQGILDDYSEPLSYEPLLSELAAAAQALSSSQTSDAQTYRLLKLGVYLVRTATYARLAQEDKLVFDSTEAGRAIGNSHVAQVLNERDHSDNPSRRINDCISALRHLLHDPPINQHKTLTALAVELTRGHPHAASLVTQVILGESLNYSSITPPPI